MKIKNITVSNFRKITNVKINLDKNITVIAGANNSGKTSLTELFNIVFGTKLEKFRSEDISVIACRDWGNEVYTRLFNLFSLARVEITAADIYNSIFPPDNAEDELTIPPIKVSVEVEYDENKDDIRLFASYIMELDPNNKCFYFVYAHELNRNKILGKLSEAFENIRNNMNNIVENPQKSSQAILNLKEKLVKIYAESCEDKAYFSDKKYENLILMETATFKNLFNYSHIIAGRNLDDESTDKAQLLSKKMIEMTSEDESWKELTKQMPEKIKQSIEDSHIKEKVRSVSIDSLSETMRSISQTNGGQNADIVIDMNVTDESVKSLLKNVTCAKYQAGDYFLSESSQGLGYSNLIYIHLQLELFFRKVDKYKINFFVIEEPESHMHPQMQNVFSEYLFKYYKNNGIIQGIVTTHSHEVVRNAAISQLRVLRQHTAQESKLYDLREFYDSLIGKKDMLDFYDWFYAINFPDIIFADKIIVYEGDTERMMIKNILQMPEYEELKNQYISFVQVGGAYGFNYKAILDFLEIKTLMITDIDYLKAANDSTAATGSHSTNFTLNKFAKISINKDNPTIQELYDWSAQSGGAPIIGFVYLAFQTDNDHYARTLEEAMLAKFLGISVFKKLAHKDWSSIRTDNKLVFTIPCSEESSIRDVVSHSSDSKTDFMYSVILSALTRKMLPHYIEEGLKWLIN